MLVGSSGLEPPTSRLSGARSNHLSYEPISLSRCILSIFALRRVSASGGDDGIRTHDPLLAGQVLSQLSYTPVFSGVPLFLPILQNRTTTSFHLSKYRLAISSSSVIWVCFHSEFRMFFLPYCSSGASDFLHRKEVIQPHLPIRLPCYDLTPIIEPTFGCCPLAVSSQTSGVPNFHGLTGGVYKARERIHRGMLIRDY